MKKVISLIMVLALCFQFSSICYGLEGAEPFFEQTEGYIYVENEDNPSQYDYSTANEVLFNNCVIDDSVFLKDVPLEKLDFDNCEFTVENFIIPETVNEFSLSGGNADALKTIKDNRFTSLRFENIQVDDLSFLDGVYTEKLRLTELRMSSLKGIEKIKGLRDFMLESTLIQSLEPLSQAEDLRVLTLDVVAVESIAPIKNLKIGTLFLSDCNFIKDLDVITEMDTLNSVYLGNSEPIVTQKVIDFVKNLEYGEDYSQLLETNRQVKEIAQQYISKGKTDDEKIKLTVEYVLSHIKYDHRVEEDDDLTIEYGNNRLFYALQGKGICTGFAGLTAALLNCVGIKTFIVEGDNHSYNMVLKDGKYYWLDTTWMEYATGPEEYDSHECYMVPYDDENFLETHKFHSIPSDLYNEIYNISTQEKVENTQENTPEVSENNNDDYKQVIIAALALAAVVIIIICVIVVKKKQKDKKLGL